MASFFLVMSVLFDPFNNLLVQVFDMRQKITGL